VYGGNGILSYTNKSNTKNTVVIGRVGAYCGSLYLEFGACWISDNAIFVKSKLCEEEYFDYCLLKSLSLSNHHIGTGQPLLTQKILNAIKIPIPDVYDIIGFNKSVKPLYSNICHNLLEIDRLIKTQKILLSNLVR
jgi:type I restriction enzyme S subunit